MKTSDRRSKERAFVRVKELRERDRRRLLKHFLALGEDDRLLRFGTVLSDELIEKYVQRIDFSHDSVFGVYGGWLHSLVGVGHLAFVPREQMPVIGGTTTKSRTAEFGVSVSAEARGRGVGSKLFERAMIHCRNEDVDTLYMHCLTSNQTMMHIARKAGMAIHREYGEADAYLTLPPADPQSVLREAMEEQVAEIDYRFRKHMRSAVKWWNRLGKLWGR
jgi:RimJ/RimL family protein N-acetyltransferase